MSLFHRESLIHLRTMQLCCKEKRRCGDAEKDWLKIFICQCTILVFKKIYCFVVCKKVPELEFYFSNIFDTITGFMSCQIT